MGARTNRQCEDGAYCTIDCDNSGDNQCCLTELTRSCESKTREDACAHQVPIEEVTIEQKINELSFKYIDRVEKVAVQALSEPFNVVKAVFLYEQMMSSIRMHTSDWTMLTPFQGAAFVTKTDGQFISMNGNHHNIPNIPSTSCAWLASTDTVEGAVNVLMKRDSTVYTIGDESVEITMDGRAFWSPDGASDFVPVDFPFFFKIVTCSKPSLNVIECKGIFSHARFVYYPDTGVTTIYGDMRGGIKRVQGAIGFPMNTTELPRRPLPSGTNAVNEEQFLNSYEVSNGAQCQYNEEASRINVEGHQSDVCNDAFAPF